MPNLLALKEYIGMIGGNREQLPRYMPIACHAILVSRSCLADPQDSLPPEVHEMIAGQYVNCINVNGAFFTGGVQLGGESSSAGTGAAGGGIIRQQELARGITGAICHRIRHENPCFQAKSQTRYEEIGFAKRTARKVTEFQDGGWIISRDQEIQDRVHWKEYSCPGELDFIE